MGYQFFYCSSAVEVSVLSNMFNTLFGTKKKFVVTIFNGKMEIKKLKEFFNYWKYICTLIWHYFKTQGGLHVFWRYQKSQV